MPGIMIRLGRANRMRQLWPNWPPGVRETFRRGQSAGGLGLMLRARTIVSTAEGTRRPYITTLLVEVDGQLGVTLNAFGRGPRVCDGGVAPRAVGDLTIAQPWHGRGVAQALHAKR